MRWTGWVLLVGVIGLTGPVAGYEPGCATCNGGPAAATRIRPGFDADPGMGPAGYCLAPGCCEEHHHCCDNAWAGYCEHRARVDAFWAHVGTPHANPYRRPCRAAPMAVSIPDSPCSSGTMHPTPATPAPTPPRAGNKDLGI